MKPLILLGTGLIPGIRNDNIKGAVEPVHRTEFPMLPIEARNQFKKSSKSKVEVENIPEWPDYLGQKLDVKG